MKNGIVRPKLLFVGVLFFGLLNYPFIQMASSFYPASKIEALSIYIVVIWLAAILLMYLYIAHRNSPKSKDGSE